MGNWAYWGSLMVKEIGVGLIVSGLLLDMENNIKIHFKTVSKKSNSLEKRKAYFAGIQDDIINGFSLVFYLITVLLLHYFNMPIMFPMIVYVFILVKGILKKQFYKVHILVLTIYCGFMALILLIDYLAFSDTSFFLSLVELGFIVFAENCLLELLIKIKKFELGYSGYGFLGFALLLSICLTAYAGYYLKGQARVIGIIIFFIDIIFIKGLFEALKIKEKQYEQIMLNNTYDGLKQQVLAIKQSEENIKKIRHDLYSHMQIVQSVLQDSCANINEYEANRKKALYYLHSVAGNYNVSEYVEISNNPIFNAVISIRQNKCRQLGIKMYVTIIKDMCFMKDADMVGLLSNMLDNAIEACAKQKLSEDCSDKMCIELSVKKADHNFIISVLNTVNENIQCTDNTWVTTKEDYLNHGYGTKIMKDIVKKYNGQIEYYVEKNTVTCTVRI